MRKPRLNIRTLVMAFRNDETKCWHPQSHVLRCAAGLTLFTRSCCALRDHDKLASCKRACQRKTGRNRSLHELPVVLSPSSICTTSRIEGAKRETSHTTHCRALQILYSLNAQLFNYATRRSCLSREAVIAGGVLVCVPRPRDGVRIVLDQLLDALPPRLGLRTGDPLIQHFRQVFVQLALRPHIA